MLKQTAFRTGSVALVLMLGACTWFQQPAAPVVAGTQAGGYGVNPPASTTTTSNPYGATPYDPNAAAVAAPVTPTPYTPSASAAAPTYNSGSTYTPSYAPVDINAATHTVVRGDTVYNISKRYHISQDDLRAWNNLNGNNISVGQVLRVKPAGYVAPRVSTAAPASVATPAPRPSTTTPSASTGGVRNESGITWQRPTAGTIISNFGGTNKGVDIAGQPGQAVMAAADGKVVYAGSGLRGYGNLVIVQHNSTFLTAYGNNQSLLVKEGQTVRRGQTIARMGSSDANRTKLHFEVRKNGKPVNPTSYVAF